MTDLLELALDDLVPFTPDERPDWADVLARSRPAPSRWRRHPRRAAALALGLVLVVVLATPALGVQGYVLHLLGRKNVSFGSSPSAPNVVKKQFFDLPVGAPTDMAPQVQAGEARTVATFSIAGHPRRLWVAPTVQGGYCYTFELDFGGCRAKAADRDLGARGQFGVTWTAASPRLPGAALVGRVGGDLTAPTASRITAHYADGATADVPFVWVSRPIAAGFYTYDIPVAHRSRQHRLLDLTLYDGKGKVLGRQTFQYNPSPRFHAIPPARVRVSQPRVLPTAPPAAPSAPVQEGSADGFQVVVGHNGAAQFTQTGTTPILSGLAGHNVGFSCFRLTREFGIFTVRGLGQWGRLAAKVGFLLSGVGTPVDGCEVQASIGRLWPDRLRDRAAVEIPLTAAGRRFFADRQAARDLALFVRSRRVHQLRREPAARARADILAAYGNELSRSPIRIAAVDAETLRFSERSGTGRTFSVTVRRGRITAENLKPYALVF